MKTVTYMGFYKTEITILDLCPIFRVHNIPSAFIYISNIIGHSIQYTHLHFITAALPVGNDIIYAAVCVKPGVHYRNTVCLGVLATVLGLASVGASGASGKGKASNNNIYIRAYNDIRHP